MAKPDKSSTAGPDAPVTTLPPKVRVKIVGVGGAGGNTITHIAAARQTQTRWLAGVELVAVNTDAAALESVTGAETLQIGAPLTHGLGAGGDQEIGARAAQQDAERLTAAVENADVIFLMAGLGGGTGGGAAPVVARLAREKGALVLAFVALPFSFEGERRRQQATLALEQLKAQADAVIGIPNDKLFRIVGEQATAAEAFHKCDELIGSGAQALWQLLARKGLINLDFAALRMTLGGKHGDGFFSTGLGEGQHKAREAVRALQENPLLDGGQALARSETVLISILGGPDLTLTDVQRTVEPISRLAPRAHVIMGAAIDDEFRGKLAVTVIAATGAARSVPGKPAVQTVVVRPGQPAAPAPQPPRKIQTVDVQVKNARTQLKQETLPLDNVSRGRFDKSEPTIYDGQDLDVPTFLRRGIRLG